MKIAATADLHFNAGYDEDLVDSMSQIQRECLKQKVDLIAIAGDIYDCPSNPDSRNPAAECIQSLADVAPVLIVKGNHDAMGDLKILSRLKSNFPIMVDESYACRKFFGATIHSLPWVTKARWMSLNQGIGKEASDKSVSQMVLEYLKNAYDIQKSTDGEAKQIVVGHALVNGSRAQNHQKLRGEGVVLGQYDLQEIGFYAGILGHIHLRQDLGGNPMFFYPGSIASLNYGEQGDKFFSIIDTTENSVEWFKLNTVSRETVGASWTSSGAQLDDLDKSSIQGARVRVSLRIDGGDNLEAAKNSISETLYSLGALEVQIDPQVITKEDVRSADMARCDTKQDMLRAYWDATSAPDEETQKDMMEKLEYVLEELCDFTN